jgi:hypothetical protein
MAEEPTTTASHEADRTTNPDVRHEPRDVQLKPLLLVLGTVLVAAAAIYVAVWLFFSGYQANQDRVKASTYPLADVPSSSGALPKGPRLEQIDRLSSGGELQPPAADGYGEGDEAGFVRVPVERAMDHLAGKLPSRPEPDADARRRAGGLVAAGESNSGRTFRKGGR